MINNNIKSPENKISNTIKDLSIAVFGLSGTGSIICQSLAHMGIRSFVLIDDDIIKKENLNKIVNSTPADAINKKPKCDVMYDLIKKISDNKCDVKTIYKKFNRKTKNEIKKELKNIDFVFVCVDEYLGREEINDFCVITKKPFIVCGVGMKKDKDIITHMLGQIFFIKTGEPCLRCHNYQNGLTYGDRDTPFIQINSIIANLGINEFLKYFTGLAKTYHCVGYDAIKSHIKTADVYEKMQRCDLCLEYVK